MRRALFSPLLLAAAACSSPDDDGGAGPTPTAVPVAVDAVALSPFAIEVRWTSAVDTVSPVAFDGGDGEETVTGDDETTDHVVLLQSLGASTTYDIRVGDGTGFGGTTSATTPAAPSGTFRVLFDAAHGEYAGNSDWVIDDQGPAPSPANPSSEDDWGGAYSAFGFALHDTGRYDVESQRTGTFQVGSGTTDLVDYCAVVVPEPNSQIPAGGLSALRSYVENGGGALLIANHDGSDRDDDGWQSLDVLNELADLDDALGWRFDAQSLTVANHDGIVDDPREPLLHGPFGDVATMGFYSATTLRIVPADNDRMRPILWRPNQSGNAGLFIAAGFYGDGKLVLVGDSAPADDGTANPGNSEIHDSWNDPTEDNAAFFLNAVAWLCDDG